MKLLTGIVILFIVFSSCKQTETEPELFARPDYEIKDIETDLFGKKFEIQIVKNILTLKDENKKLLFYK